MRVTKPRPLESREMRGCPILRGWTRAGGAQISLDLQFPSIPLSNPLTSPGIGMHVPGQADTCRI